MKYLCLIYENEANWATMTKDEGDKVMKEYFAFTADTTQATTVRQRDGKTLTIDGPFAETKEQLGGYYIVECANLDEAIEAAERIPSLAGGGSVEVRPLIDM